MRTDRYTRIMLTVIAVALLAIVLRPEVKAASAQASSVHCTGTLRANAFGGTEKLIGGYQVDISCR